VRRLIGQQADLADAEVGEDLAAEAYLAEDSLVARVGCMGCGAGAVRVVDAESCRLCGLVDGEAALGVVEIDEGATARGSYGCERRVDRGAAVAGGGTEDVAGEAVGVDADEDGGVLFLSGRWGGGEVAPQVAIDEGDMGVATFYGVGLGHAGLALVRDHAEVSVDGGEGSFRDAVDIALMGHAVTDEVGYGDHLQLMRLAEGDEVGDAGHGAVFVHDLADDAGGDEAGHAGEVDGGFGLAGANENATFAGAEREDVSGTGEVVGTGIWADGDLDGVRAVGGGDAGGNAFAGFDGLGEGGAEARGVVLGHGAEAHVVGALFGQRQADEPAAKLGHEVDGFGGAELGGEGEVAFVLAIFVVDDDDHMTGLHLGDRGWDVNKAVAWEAVVEIGHASIVRGMELERIVQGRQRGREEISVGTIGQSGEEREQEDSSWNREQPEKDAEQIVNHSVVALVFK
jgi:hypothetical protein